MIVVIVLLALIICSFFEYSKIQDLKAANIMYQTELSNNQQTVYVATDLINAGDIVTDTGENANVEKQTVYTGLESYNYITESEMNTRAKVDIAAGVPVMYNMVTDVVVDNDTRDYEISVANLTTDQKENDVVDIRVIFPNGEDYVILSKIISILGIRLSEYRKFYVPAVLHPLPTIYNDMLSEHFPIKFLFFL